MLKSLHIENVAVIEKTDIEFEPGLNIMTGETGAGKSIVIDSLGAVLGGRVTHELIRHGSDKASISACFDCTEDAARWLGQNEIDVDEEIFLKRTVTQDGKSSCRINGSPVPVRQLQELGSLLMDIHGQNDGRKLLNESSHLAFLDSFGDYSDLLSSYAKCYEDWQSVSKKLNALTNDDSDKAQLSEILAFRIRELEEANLTLGESDELSARHDRMKNAERLTDFLETALNCLYESDNCAVSLSEQALDCVEHAQRYANELSECLKEIKDAKFMLTDAAEVLRDTRDSLDFSPEEFNAVETRLSKLNRLFKKYGTDEEGLLALLEESRTKLDDIEYSDAKIEQLKKQLQESAARTVVAGKKLTSARAKAGKCLSERVQKELSELSMPAVKFCTELSPLGGTDAFDRTGMEHVRFLMSANAGEEPGRISHIASGGELSRIMLAMKSVFMENDPVDSMVFDEIDTGVSGIAAQRVGEKMARIGRHKQVICITHLPQIACMADCAFCISKSVQGEKTYTNVQKLDRAGQVREIARLREGENVTALALQGAEEQLKSAERYKASEG